jgi:hypothetical protein
MYGGYGDIMGGKRGRQAEQDGDADAGAASAASFVAVVVAEIYLYATSVLVEILRRHGRG